MGLRAFWDPISSLKTFLCTHIGNYCRWKSSPQNMYTYQPIKLFSIPMHRPRVQAVKDLMVRGRLNETVLDIDSPLFI